jgi:hypothetical protein
VPYITGMRLYLVAYQNHQAEFVGAAIGEALDPDSARERAEAHGIHQPGAMLTVTQVSAVPVELLGRKLSRRNVMDILKANSTKKKKPPAPSLVS